MALRGKGKCRGLTRGPASNPARRASATDNGGKGGAPRATGCAGRQLLKKGSGCMWVAPGSGTTLFPSRKKERSPTHVAGELRRIEAERRFAPRKVEIEVERFELNLGKDAFIKFLNEHAGD